MQQCEPTGASYMERTGCYTNEETKDQITTVEYVLVRHGPY
jgi:hypothetical protein